MPTAPQLSLIGEAPSQPLPDPQERILCVGGCGRERPRSEMHETSEGFMCPLCAGEVYVTCDECGERIHLNRWGESENLCIGPDGREHCRKCYGRVYSQCTICNRLTNRETEKVHNNPDNGDEVCSCCWHDYWFECAICGNVTHRPDMHCDPDDAAMCEDCFNEFYVHCANCGRAILIGEHRGWVEDPYCGDCYGHADTWKTQPWSGEPGTFDKIGSKRRFGVELETADCSKYKELHGKTEWGCVYECSTPGKEFVSPILQGDNGFQEIRDFCDKARERRWTVNNSCGLHIHLDISGDSSEECMRIAYAYRRVYPMWKKFVNRHRAENPMCGSPQYTCEDIRLYEHIEDFAECRDRFEFVNWRAYLCHSSFEVRLYQGSLNAREICNWIALHARFMDAVKGMTYDELDAKFGGNTRKHWPALCDLLDDTNLLDYWRRKAGNHGNHLPTYWETDETTEAPETTETASDEVEWTAPLPARSRPRSPSEEFSDDMLAENRRLWNPFRGDVPVYNTPDTPGLYYQMPEPMPEPMPAPMPEPVSVSEPTDQRKYSERDVCTGLVSIDEAIENGALSNQI